MKYRFITFKTYGSEERQYSCNAFASDNMERLNQALFKEIGELEACGHTNFVVRETCDADNLKKYNIHLQII